MIPKIPTATEICSAAMSSAQDRFKARRDAAMAVKQAAISNAYRAYFPELHTLQSESVRDVASAAADAGCATALTASEQLLNQDRAAAVATLAAGSMGSRGTTADPRS
jgi:hypothetical protein